MGQQYIADQWSQVGTKEGSKSLQVPPEYRVVMLNDDYTPMEFVTGTLEKYFEKQREEAQQLMMQVHNQGSAICGIYTRDVAQSKALQVICYARELGHPLMCEAVKD